MDQDHSHNKTHTHLHEIRSNVWQNTPSCPINDYSIQQLLMVTGKSYTKDDTNPLFVSYVFDAPPLPFSKLELAVLKPNVYAQFRGKVHEIPYPQAKQAQQILNNWLAGVGGIGGSSECIGNVPLAKPWEKLVTSKTVRFEGGSRKFLYNLTNAYGHGIEALNDNMVQKLTQNLYYSLNVEDGALVVNMPNPNNFYLTRFTLPSLEKSVKAHMDAILQEITGPEISIQAYGTYIGQHKASMLHPLIDQGYSFQRVENELRAFKVVDEGKAVIVQYHIGSGVLIVTSVGGVPIQNFLGLKLEEQNTNRLFSQYVLGEGMKTDVPTYAYETPTPLSYMMGGVKQGESIESYQTMGNFGVGLAVEKTIAALPPLIGYIFKLEGNTLKIFMIVSCLCDTERLFSYHLVELESSVAYFAGSCSHKTILQNI